MRRVVLVTDRESIEQQLGAALKGEAYEVLHCPGPQRPGYVCPADSGRLCPIAVAADAVVLDMNLASDDSLEGTPTWMLLVYYMSLGVPVVALGDEGDASEFARSEGVFVLPRFSDPLLVVGAVEDAIRAGRGAVRTRPAATPCPFASASS